MIIIGDVSDGLHDLKQFPIQHCKMNALGMCGGLFLCSTRLPLTILLLYRTGLPPAVLLLYRTRLPPMVLGLSVLSKGVEISPTGTQLSPTCV